MYYWILIGILGGLLVGFGIGRFVVTSARSNKLLSGDLYRDGNALYLVPYKNPSEFEKGEIVRFVVHDLYDIENAKREKS